MEFGWQISDALELGAQATLSRSRIDEFTEVIYDYLDYSTVEIVHQNTEIAFARVSSGAVSCCGTRCVPRRRPAWRSTSSGRRST